MSAEDYFLDMLNVPGVSPVIEGNKIWWVAERYPQPDGLFNDFQGWDNDKYYSTIQTTDVDGDGRDELLARGAGGMLTIRFDPNSSSWQLIDTDDPPFADAVGWGNDKYYSTIQTADVDGDGRDELLARSAGGMLTYRFDSNSSSWQIVPVPVLPFTDAQGWDYHKYYSTIQTADVDGDGRDELLARGAGGMLTYRYDSNSSNWLLLSAPNRIYLCGRDDCQWGLSNQNFNTLVTGQVPTYYHVIEDAEGRAQIAYWWFYGWQPPCNSWDVLYYGDDGAHHGDWEHVMITTTPDREAVEWVTFFFHGDWYTRHVGGFELDGEHPVVYVGKLGHGSYHNGVNGGFGVGLPLHCCEFADYRNPKVHTVWHTHLNLVDLDKNEESWMLADRKESQYDYEGQSYTIVPWRWGPLHAYCNGGIVGQCLDWEHSEAPGTHPTKELLDWQLRSCDGVGCGTSECDGIPYPFLAYFNQSWPWDTGVTQWISIIEQANSCGT